MYIKGAAAPPDMEVKYAHLCVGGRINVHKRRRCSARHGGEICAFMRGWAHKCT